MHFACAAARPERHKLEPSATAAILRTALNLAGSWPFPIERFFKRNAGQPVEVISSSAAATRSGNTIASGQLRSPCSVARRGGPAEGRGQQLQLLRIHCFLLGGKSGACFADRPGM